MLARDSKFNLSLKVDGACKRRGWELTTEHGIIVYFVASMTSTRSPIRTQWRLGF